MAEASVPPEASVASTGLSIRYIGDHCYAYSGFFSSNTSAQTVLDFTTGSGYIIGILQADAFVETAGDIGSGAHGLCYVEFNGINVALLKTDGQYEDMPAVTTVNLVIPPFTEVRVKYDASVTTATIEGCVSLTGRVYGAE